MKRYILVFNLICTLSWFVNGQSERMQIPVTTGDGTLIDAWKGGFSNPQVSTIDFNLDGLEDVLIFDRIGGTFFPYEQTDAGLEYGLRFDGEATSLFPKIRSWILLRDYNDDGVQDIFCHSTVVGIPGVSVFKGVESNGSLAFEQQFFGGSFPEVLQVPAGSSTTNLYVSEDDIPAIEDFDGDGDLDIASFTSAGSYIGYYRNYAVERELGLDALEFELEDFCWGKIFESDFSEDIVLSSDPENCAEALVDPELENRHAGSTLLAFDEDGDGLMEMLVGDLAYGRLSLLDNEGSTESAFVTDLVSNFPLGPKPVDIPFFVASYYADVDQDGDRDLLAAPNGNGSTATVDVLWFYRNDGTDDNPDFAFVQEDIFAENNLDFGMDAAPAFVDYNADGLVDLVVGTSGTRTSDGGLNLRLVLMENVGTVDFPAYEIVDEDYLGFSQFFPMSSALTPDFGDLDGDGDLDLIVGKQDGRLVYGENAAGAGNPIDIPSLVVDFMDIDVGVNAAPTIGDANGDGLGDLIIGERNGNTDSNGDACSVLNYFQNIGSISDPQFESDVTTLPNTPCAGSVFLERSELFTIGSSPKWFQSEDGRELLFVASDIGSTAVFTNISDQIYGTFMEVDSSFGGLDEGFRAHVDLEDIDADGLLEIVIGNSRGGLTLYGTDLDALSLLVDVEDTQVLDQVAVFPNPSDGVVNVESSIPVKVDIWTTDGRLIKRIDHHASFHTINISGSGIYWLQVLDKDGNSRTEKLILSE